MAGSERSGFAVKRLGGLPGRLLRFSNQPLRVFSNLLVTCGGRDLRWGQQRGHSIGSFAWKVIVDFELTTEGSIEFVGNLWRSGFEVETMAMGDFTWKVIVVFDINHPGCSRIR